MKIRLFTALITVLLSAASLHAQAYRPAELSGLSVNSTATTRSVQVRFTVGTVPAPTVILHYSGAKTFSMTGNATVGSSLINLATPFPLNPGERYELQSVEFSDGGGNTIFQRFELASRGGTGVGSVDRFFYAGNFPTQHTIAFTAADFGPTSGQQFGGTGRAQNLSTRGVVGAGDSAMIVGIVVTGGAKTFLFRAIGPGLAAFGLTGYVANPKIELKNQAGQSIMTNDDWRDFDADMGFSMTAVGAFVPAEKDAALRARLIPGNYTLVISGADGSTGIALAEAYEMR